MGSAREPVVPTPDLKGFWLWSSDRVTEDGKFRGGVQSHIGRTVAPRGAAVWVPFPGAGAPPEVPPAESVRRGCSGVPLAGPESSMLREVALSLRN